MRELDMRSIRSPQAPADIQPVPPLELSPRVFGVPAKVVEATGASTIGELLTLCPQRDFTAFAGVGPKTNETIHRMLSAYEI